MLQDFPQTLFGDKQRRFNKAWYNQYPYWLEYSIQKDAAYCLCCYLFKTENREGGGDAFTSAGFKNWKSKKSLDEHVGGLNSAHNVAVSKCQNLMKQEQSIQTVLEGQSKHSQNAYRLRLTASLDCIRFLLRQGLAFRGNDESEGSSNRGNFLELLRFLADHNAMIEGVVLQNAPKNMKLVAPEIQKDIIAAAAAETTNKIMEELGDELFSVLVDESRDVSCKEQMAVILRFVNKQGSIVERFLAVVHVKETTSLSLKTSLEELFCKHKLSFSRLRGQGYDGASNMRGEFNGLKALILKENSSAYYVHCFAHQLQLVLVAVAERHKRIATLFNIISTAQNTVGASCQRRDKLREERAAEVKKALVEGDISSGTGLHQEVSLARASDTRWSSHYKSLTNLTILFGTVMVVLDDIMENAKDSRHRAITNELSDALQKKEQEIINAIDLVMVAKNRLQDMRDNGWGSLLGEVHSFCVKHNIDVLNMEAEKVLKRSECAASGMTNGHYYRIDLFNSVIDLILQELNDRFTEINTELLRCMSCLHPRSNFSAFDKVKLIELAHYYPNDFSNSELCILESQLDCYIHDLRADQDFSQLNEMGVLAQKLVARRKDIVYPLVYKLIKLALILPVATATVERAFSAMNIIKTRLRNRMGDDFLNDNLVTFIEKDKFREVPNEVIMQRFQIMRPRK
ncbi:hypothetical protein LUZ61_002650 [Rhynchospora tenuis]|uniref:TTF-type domain-containing protein n=1 Tax=Rhynchospora tenuis TaxID=198213 RepID=A0AAD5ZJB3_9POAL|nr:hypothetical protein LUZ61_002650 [Rhynchospora tenuis]